MESPASLGLPASTASTWHPCAVALSTAEHRAVQRQALAERNESARVGRLLRRLATLEAENARLRARVRALEQAALDVLAQPGAGG